MAKIVIESMQTLIDSKINNLKFNKKRKAVVQSLNQDGTVDITINDDVFENVEVRTGLLPQVGEVVKVEIPNNSIRDMYVDTALKNSFDLLLNNIDGGLFIDDIYTELSIDGGMFVYE